MLRTIPLILLIVLVYVFRLELFMSGNRFYTLAVPNPALERTLGDYYQDTAKRSTLLADSFYQSALKKYQTQLATAPDNMKASIQLAIGSFYECGRGVKADPNEAKHWYEEASKSDKTNSAVGEALNRMNKAPGTDQGTPSVCNLTNDIPVYLR